MDQDEKDQQVPLWRQRVKRAVERVRPILPEPSFITFHYAYFIVVCLIASLVFYGSSTPAKSVRFIDAVFLAVSAMTEAGLNTINLSQLNTWQQIILFLLIMMGSAIFVSGAVLHVRKRAFETKLQELADRRRKRLRRPLRVALSFSRSKQKAQSSDRREAEVAAGVIRGRTMHDPPSDQPYIPSFPRRERINTDPDSETAINNTSVQPEPPPPRAGTNRIHFAESSRQPTLDRTNIYQRSNRYLFSNSGVGAHSLAAHPRNSGPLLDDEQAILDSTEKSVDEKVQGDVHTKLNKYVDTINGYLGRNSQFFDLTEKERRQLGGIEYDALNILSYVVALYFVLFQLIGAIGCGAWMQINQAEVALSNGLNPFWTGAFFAISAFNNSGMALLDANATVLQESYYMLLTLSLLILAGNTCFPPFLRLIIWTLKSLAAGHEGWRDTRKTLQFILDHPRRVYTNLFPGNATWWLVLSLVLLNGADWFAFEVFNIGNPVVEGIAPKYRALDGLFQAFAVRAGGFYVVSIAGLYPGTLVLYVIMMYLSAFPVTMTIRNTNVYEERSLAIYAEDTAPPSDMEPLLPSPPSNMSLGTKKKPRSFSMRSGTSGISRMSTGQSAGGARAAWSRSDFVRQQLHGQLGHDLWWLSLAILLITIVETGQHLTDPVNFSIFNIVFEVVSAYGTVGISVGVPWAAYSFSGAWHTVSKLILCAVMLRGRHRGLPVAIDRAILLPDSTLWWAEEEDGRMRRARTNSFGSASRSNTFRHFERDLQGLTAIGSEAI